MNKARILLVAIWLISLSGGVLAFKIRIDLPLFYLRTFNNEDICVTSYGLVSTTTTLGTVSVPVGATGWYTTEICEGATVRARTTGN